MGNYVNRELVIHAIMKTLEELQSADVLEHVYGQWEYEHYPDTWKCSHCGHIQTEKTNFCPNCGSDNREDRGGKK